MDATAPAELRCPKCGCNDVSLRPQRGLWGTPGYACGCRFCGARFQLDDPAAETAVAYQAVEFAAQRCPHCGSTQTEVASTRRKAGQPTVRYHACRGCQAAFKSVEPA
jgi:transcription elongation factor Elf1